ncbi:undecaprenyl diphosphate synthase [Parelusimicrobium proximum]|uniref:isoprenyl transferase n=1 Tax=Parelusimicrobium proximum TaxID=3228953 RepID=UPI003D17F0CB
MQDKLQPAVPQHIAIIMDGNGRWAKQRGLDRNKGHEEGVKAVEKTVKKAHELGVKYLTLYAFSTENWVRPDSEIKTLMKMLVKVLDSYNEKFSSYDAKLIVSGRREPLSKDVQDKIDYVMRDTKDKKGITINIALNYGSRQEITDAVNKILKEGKAEIKDGELAEYMYSPSVPDPELIIRTSGEERLSNFLLWQAAYSEFYFTDVLWPDFNEAELEKAIFSYTSRTRRFGGIS